jgi:Tfp pilus assembly protein PilF
VPTTIRGNQKSYSTRTLSPSEVAAEEALFYIQTRREKEARASTNEALQADPNVAMAHEASGLLAYREGDYETAKLEFARSLELSPTSYVSYFFQAQARLRGGRAEFEDLREITGLLEKALALNPQFAPAYATLANFYTANPESGDKALAMAKKAIELEPGNLSYSTSYGYVLLNTGKVAAAKAYAARIQSAARTPQEQNLAAEFAHAVAAREQFPRENGYQAQLPTPDESKREGRSVEIKEESSDPTAASPKIAAPEESLAANAPPRSMLNPQYRLEGKVIAAECKPGGEVNVSLSINSVLMKFHAAEMKAVEVTPATKSLSADKPLCAAWKGQRARVTFHSLPAGEFDGELSAIYFF